MKPSFDDLFADQVRSAFDSYEEEADMVNFTQIQSQLKPKASPIFWQMKWAAILVLGLISVWIVVQKSSQKTESEVVVAESSMYKVLPSLVDILEKEKDKTAETTAPTIENSSTKIAKYKKQKSNKKTIIPLIQVDSTLLTSKLKITIDTTKNFIDSLNTPNFYAEIRKENDSLMLQTSSKPISVYAENPVSHIPKQMKFKTKWEFVAASLVTVSDNKVNDGFGFMAGAVKYWKINDYVSFGTGGILNQNQFTQPKPTLLYDSFYSDVMANSYQASNPVTETQTVQTTALDIPISFMWEFPTEKRNRYFLTLGLSSLIYLNQNFKENGSIYNGTNVVTGSSSEIVITKTAYTKTENESAFKHVDLAKLMNISVGYELDKNIVIEWFVKYPFGDLTSKELSYSLTGIGIKYSFVKTRK